MRREAVGFLSVQWAFVLALGGLAAAFCYLLIEPRRWGGCAVIIAVTLLAAGMVRSALPTRRVGWLAVRHRAFDAACYLSVGVVLLLSDIRLHG